MWRPDFKIWVCLKEGMIYLFSEYILVMYFSSCWSKNWLHVVYSFTGFCMFVLSLVKKHYRLQFYMVCISQVTLSSTAYYSSSSSSHQPLSSSHPTADFPFLLPLGEGSEICSWALTLLSLKQITVILCCTLCRVCRIWLIWNSLSAVKTLSQLVRLDLSFPTCSSTCCLLPPHYHHQWVFLTCISSPSTSLLRQCHIHLFILNPLPWIGFRAGVATFQCSDAVVFVFAIPVCLDPCDPVDCGYSVPPCNSEPIWRNDLVSRMHRNPAVVSLTRQTLY